MATTAVKKPAGKSWRVVDIVVAALIAVAGGVIFWAWSQGAAAVSGPMNAVYPPLTGLIAGGWMIPAVLGMLIIRKPGAALSCLCADRQISRNDSHWHHSQIAG